MAVPGEINKEPVLRLKAILVDEILVVGQFETPRD